MSRPSIEVEWSDRAHEQAIRSSQSLCSLQPKRISVTVPQTGREFLADIGAQLDKALTGGTLIQGKRTAAMFRGHRRGTRALQATEGLLIVWSNYGFNSLTI
jgi:hypothetical protein